MKMEKKLLSNSKIVGRHIIADLYGVKESKIAKKQDLEKIVEEAIAISGIKKIKSFYKQFKPHGVTGVVLISESHISIHTWPELGLVNLDIFTCGDLKKVESAFKVFIKRLEPKYHRKVILDRG